MSLNRVFILLFSIVITSFLSVQLDASLYEATSIFLFAYFLLGFIDSIGKTYNVLDVPILLGILQLLIMPMIVFRVYNEEYFVQALYYDMSVSEETYYGFMVPAMLLMIAGMKFPIQSAITRTISIRSAIARSQTHLAGKGSMGILLMIIGAVSGVMRSFLPGELTYVAYLFSKLLFVGIFYVLFSEFKNKNLYLIGGISFLLADALVRGLFGELIFTLILGSLLFLLGKRFSFSLKLALAVVGGVFVLLLQSIKADYRAITWYGKGGGNQSNLSAFITVFSEKISDPSQFFDRYNMFPTVNRFNQGMIQGKIMAYVPDQRPYAGGTTIANSIAASFVPRVLWPDKPISGGKWNMEYFTGFIIEGYSMNVGPFGESYGNFGPEGGIYFMLIYGLIFNAAIALLLFVAKKRPTLILWFPVLFVDSVQVETDILMTVNSLIKNSIFIWFCYWAANRFLRLKL